MDIHQLTLITINQFIDYEWWDDAFELVKNEVHDMTQEGALLTTKLVKRTKWYDQGLALLSLKKDVSEVYMKQYLKVCMLQKLERSRLSLWSKLPGPSLRDDPEDSTDTEEDEDDEEDESEDELPLAQTLESEMIMQGVSPLLIEKIDDYDQKSIESPHILEVADQKSVQSNCYNQLKLPE
mgnify:CR=1 FL=1